MHTFTRALRPCVTLHLKLVFSLRHRFQQQFRWQSWLCEKKDLFVHALQYYPACVNHFIWSPTQNIKYGGNKKIINFDLLMSLVLLVGCNGTRCTVLRYIWQRVTPSTLPVPDQEWNESGLCSNKIKHGSVDIKPWIILGLGVWPACMQTLSQWLRCANLPWRSQLLCVCRCLVFLIIWPQKHGSAVFVYLKDKSKDVTVIRANE